jgi:hypothetical protein
LTEKDLSLRKLGEDNNFEAPLQCLYTEFVVKDMVLITRSPSSADSTLLALWTKHHNQILLWNLKDDYKEPLPLADGVDILALSSSMDGSLAVVTKPSGTRSISLELWSANRDNNKEWICQRRILLEQHSHVTSMILIDNHTWVTADASWDVLLVWRNEGECVGSLDINPTRLGFACRGGQVAWIGCGSTVWLRDTRDFAST